jgi:DNA-binding MarR family transcriptional regulator
VLTQRMGLSKQAVQQLLDQLETGGLVRRETDPADKRMKHVLLTEAGQTALAARQSVADELEAQLRERFGKKLYKKLRKALREVAAP